MGVVRALTAGGHWLPEGMWALSGSEWVSSCFGAGWGFCWGCGGLVGGVGCWGLYAGACETYRLFAGAEGGRSR